MEEVKFFEVAPLLEVWHLMGAGPISRSVSLFYNDEIVSIMTYKVQEAKGIVSIERFANTPGNTIQGGFGKLVSFLEKRFPYLDIVSFCDTRYAVGSSYLALGFEEESESLGFYWTDFVNRFNRYYCQAVPGIKTEEENSLDMGLVKIYDAGQVKFRKKSKLSKE